MSAPFSQLLGELSERVDKLQALPYEQAREEIFQVLQLVDQVHRPGVERLALALGEAGLLEALLDEEAVHVLLSLYDQAPLDPVSQAEAALDAVRPYIESHGGSVEVLAVEDGEVRVRLSGACDSCSASPETLKLGVEEALRSGLSGFQRLVEDKSDAVASGSAVVQIGEPSFVAVAAAAEIPEAAPHIVDCEGRSVLLVRLADEVYAFEAECPGCGAALGEGLVSRAVLVCPLQNCAYEVRTGRRVDGMGAAGLKSYPLSLRGDGQVRLAMDFEARERFVSQ